MKTITLIAAIILMAGTVYAADPNDMAKPTRAGQMEMCFETDSGILHIQYKMTADEITTSKERPEFFATIVRYIRAGLSNVVKAYEEYLNKNTTMEEKRTIMAERTR